MGPAHLLTLRTHVRLVVTYGIDSLLVENACTVSVWRISLHFERNFKSIFSVISWHIVGTADQIDLLIYRKTALFGYLKKYTLTHRYNVYTEVVVSRPVGGVYKTRDHAISSDYYSFRQVLMVRSNAPTTAAAKAVSPLSRA